MQLDQSQRESRWKLHLGQIADSVVGEQPQGSFGALRLTPKVRPRGASSQRSLGSELRATPLSAALKMALGQ